MHNYLLSAGVNFSDSKAKSAQPLITIGAYTGGVNYKGVKGYQWNLLSANQNETTYYIKAPKLLLSCLDAKPAVNAALMHAAKDPRDGMIQFKHSVGRHS